MEKRLVTKIKKNQKKKSKNQENLKNAHINRFFSSYRELNIYNNGNIPIAEKIRWPLSFFLLAIYYYFVY